MTEAPAQKSATSPTIASASISMAAVEDTSTEGYGGRRRGSSLLLGNCTVNTSDDSTATITGAPPPPPASPSPLTDGGDISSSYISSPPIKKNQAEQDGRNRQPLKARSDSLFSSKRTASSTDYSDDDDDISAILLSGGDTSKSGCNDETTCCDSGSISGGSHITAMTATTNTAATDFHHSLSILKLPFNEVGIAGRNEELEILRRVVREVTSCTMTSKNEDSKEMEKEASTSCGLVLVSGRAGSGKSRLVSEALHGVSRGSSRSGFGEEDLVVAMGKFDQQIGNTASTSSRPFAVLSTIFCDMVHKLVESNQTSDEGRKTLSEFLQQSNEVDVVQQIVPNILCLHDLISDPKRHDSMRTKNKSEKSRPLSPPCSDESLDGAANITNRQFTDDADDKISVSAYSASTFGLAEQTQVFDVNRNKNVMLLSVRKFVRTLCSCFSNTSLVMVVEDLQWADQESLDLLTLIATDRESSGLVLILTFRDNEKTAAKDTMQPRWDLVKKNGVFSITHIKLHDLSNEDVSTYLEKLLSADRADVAELASITYKKTRGNPFFLKQFLTSLYDNEFLRMNQGTFKWDFDVDRIRSDTTIADDVAGLMTSNMRRKLPQEAIEILFISACIGSAFEEEMIVLIVHALQLQESEDQKDSAPSKDDAKDLVESALLLCTTEGLLERSVLRSAGNDMTSAQYAFTHDYIQMTAFSLVEESDRRMLQWKMGDVLLQTLDDDNEEGDSKIFAAADLFGRGYEKGMRMTKLKTLSLIKLNIRAGRNALKSSAFSAALGYFRFAIAYLQDFPDGSCVAFLESHRKLWLQLHESAAEAAFCCGDHTEMKRYLDKIIHEPSIEFEEKLNAYATLTKSLGTENNPLEATTISLETLKKLGVRMRTKYLKLSILRNLIKTKRLLDKYTSTELVELPLMEDSKMIATMRIMDTALTYTYATNLDLHVLLIMKMTRRSVKYGICRYSPVAFGAFANLTGGVLGDLKQGHSYANVSLEILKRLNVKEMDARTTFITYNFVLHWQDPVSQSFKPYLRGYQLGLACGDLENAMFCITYHCDVAMHTGRRLSLVTADFNAYTKQMEDFGLDYNRFISLVPWQLALNLMGRADDPCTLTGDAMDQDQMTEIGKDIPFIKHIMDAARLSLAVYFHDYETARDMILRNRNLATTNLGQSVVWRSSLFEGLAAFSLARCGNGSSGSWKKHAKKVTNRVESWVSKGNLNCLHHLLLLKAEMETFQQKTDEVTIRAAYDKAIASAARIGFLNDQALAYERAGAYFVTVGGKNGDFWSSHYLKSAYELYLEWEAFGKTKHLRRLYPNIFVQPDRTS